MFCSFAERCHYACADAVRDRAESRACALTVRYVSFAQISRALTVQYILAQIRFLLPGGVRRLWYVFCFVCLFSHLFVYLVISHLCLCFRLWIVFCRLFGSSFPPLVCPFLCLGLFFCPPLSFSLSSHCRSLALLSGHLSFFLSFYLSDGVAVLLGAVDRPQASMNLMNKQTAPKERTDFLNLSSGKVLSLKKSQRF